MTSISNNLRSNFFQALDQSVKNKHLTSDCVEKIKGAFIDASALRFGRKSTFLHCLEGIAQEFHLGNKNMRHIKLDYSKAESNAKSDVGAQKVQKLKQAPSKSSAKPVAQPAPKLAPKQVTTTAPKPVASSSSSAIKLPENMGEARKAHPFSDTFPPDYTIYGYSKEESFKMVGIENCTGETILWMNILKRSSFKGERFVYIMLNRLASKKVFPKSVQEFEQAMAKCGVTPTDKESEAVDKVLEHAK